MDIIDQNMTSKLNILSLCETRMQELGSKGDCLCIGDMGRWPGNDYHLLSTPYSLSDEGSIVTGKQIGRAHV